MDQLIPDSFVQFPTSQITKVLSQLISKRNKNITYVSPKSCYGKAVQELLGRESTLEERKFLYDL